MKGRVKGSDHDVTYRYNIKNKNLSPKNITHHLNPFIQFRYMKGRVKSSDHDVKYR